MTVPDPELEYTPPEDDPLRRVSPSTADVEAKRARSAIESRLFGGTAKRIEVGRYRIEGKIGAGGMGVVYRAHDPELARDVAVKLLNTEAMRGSDAETASARLVREARAMARLAHPNVIHVYDVGTVEHGVFIAMELVEGNDLASWLKSSQRAWREVLKCCIDAGKGLAAAHAAGVIHRDFKPENVLVGDDGRVRVVDFGLAGGSAKTGRHQTLEDAGELDSAVDMSGSLTRTGAMLGTPMYMAPEQHAGSNANARSDQFSFCVTLFSALYGYPPFSGDTISQYRRNVRDGWVAPAPPDTQVPRWIYDEVVRGLAVDPVARHPGLDVLLGRLCTALEEPGAGRSKQLRRALLGTGFAAAVIGALSLGLAINQADEEAKEPVAVVEPAPQPEPEPPVKKESADKPEPEPAPKPEPETKSQDTASSTPVLPAKKAKTKARMFPKGNCYFKEDGLAFIAEDRKRRRFPAILGDGKCYKCRPIKGSRAKLNPRDCTKNFQCWLEPDQCDVD